jgi:hypothetical protein
LAEIGGGTAVRVSLPPLPPVGGEITGRNVVDVITEQHAELLALCDRLAGDQQRDVERFREQTDSNRPGEPGDAERPGEPTDTKRPGGPTDARRPGGPGDAERLKVAQVMTATLARHLSGEEQYLYPTVRRVVPGGVRIADRELAEDHDLLVLLKRWSATRPGDQDFDSLAADVTAAVRRHVAADAADLLPALAQTAPIEDLIRVGNRLETAEEAAPTRPHPATPSTPPWNKVVDPVVALADKARDAMSRRVTYRKDL